MEMTTPSIAYAVVVVVVVDGRRRMSIMDNVTRRKAMRGRGIR